MFIETVAKDYQNFSFFWNISVDVRFLYVTRTKDNSKILANYHITFHEDYCNWNWQASEVDGDKHRLNVELILQSLFGLHVRWCAQLYSLVTTPQFPTPIPRLWALICTRAPLVSQPRARALRAPIFTGSSTPKTYFACVCLDRFLSTSKQKSYPCSAQSYNCDCPLPSLHIFVRCKN